MLDEKHLRDVKLQSHAASAVRAQLVLTIPLHGKLFDNGSPTAPCGDLPRFSWWNACGAQQGSAMPFLRLPVVFTCICSCGTRLDVLPPVKSCD